MLTSSVMIVIIIFVGAVAQIEYLRRKSLESRVYHMLYSDLVVRMMESLSITTNMTEDGDEEKAILDSIALLKQAQADNAAEILEWRRAAQDCGIHGEPEKLQEHIRELKASKESLCSINDYLKENEGKLFPEGTSEILKTIRAKVKFGVCKK